MRFNNNEERDAYLKKVVHWISKEQFAMRSGKLKVGELCEAHVGNRWEKGSSSQSCQSDTKTASLWRELRMTRVG